MLTGWSSASLLLRFHRLLSLACVLRASVPVYGWLACALRLLHPSAPRRQASDLVCCDYLLPPRAVLTASDHRLGEIDIQSFTSAQSPRASAPPPPPGGVFCFARDRQSKREQISLWPRSRIDLKQVASGLNDELAVVVADDSAVLV